MICFQTFVMLLQISQKKNYASVQGKNGFWEAFRSQETLEGAAGFQGCGWPCFTAPVLWAPDSRPNMSVMLLEYKFPELLPFSVNMFHFDKFLLGLVPKGDETGMGWADSKWQTLSCLLPLH